MKYEIKLSEGCTCFGITVNGRDYTDEMTEAERHLFLLDMLLEIRLRYRNGQIGIRCLLELLEVTGTWESDGACETCGDYVAETTYQIK